MIANLLDYWLHGEKIVFGILAVIMIISALLMINFTRVVHMVVSLALVFLSLAGIYILLEAEFVAFVQVLIYAGAVSILMIFGIMMTRHQEDVETLPRGTVSQGLLFFGVVILFGLIAFAIQDSSFETTGALGPIEDNTRAIGELIYTLHVIPFELVSVLLTVAFIGAIVLTKREEEE